VLAFLKNIASEFLFRAPDSHYTSYYYFLNDFIENVDAVFVYGCFSRVISCIKLPLTIYLHRAILKAGRWN